MIRLAIPALALTLGGCASVPAAGPVTGEWGGDHVGLTLQASGGSLDYDCAAGTIGPVVPDSGGRFTAAGSHTPAMGGPDRVGEVRPSYAARYSGTVRGNRMTLTGRTSNGLDLGPFVLERGRPANLLRCL